MNPSERKALLWGGLALGAIGAWCMVSCDGAPAGGSSMAIDDYAPHEPPMSCDPHAKPGMLLCRKYLLRRFGQRPGSPENIVRGCSAGDGQTSEHIEGRAFDLMTNGTAHGDQVVSELLAPDADGNAHALIRRLGIMYIIWNRRMWRAYQHPAGTRVWTPYTGPNPHTDHVHLSLGWDGARAETSGYRGALDLEEGIA
jgi:hypothetical protein